MGVGGTIVLIVVLVAFLVVMIWLLVKLLKEWLGKRPKQELTNEELKNNGALFILNGGTSKLCVYEDKLEKIYGNDFATRLLNMGDIGNVIMPYNTITSVQMLEGTPKKFGRFDFGILGGQHKYNTRDNIFVFDGNENETALKIKDFILEKISKNSASNNNVSNAEEIAKYKKLLDDGIITQKEFESKKRQLLGL